MRSHVAGLRECFAAFLVGASVGLAANVVVQVGLQMVFLRECLGAYRAGERLDPGMQSLMKLK